MNRHPIVARFERDGATRRVRPVRTRIGFWWDLTILLAVAVNATTNHDVFMRAFMVACLLANIWIPPRKSVFDERGEFDRRTAWWIAFRFARTMRARREALRNVLRHRPRAAWRRTGTPIVIDPPAADR